MTTKIPGTPEQRAARRTLVDALLSGKYEQAHFQLRTSSGYCCLAVACDVSNLGTWQHDALGILTYVVSETDKHSSFLPEAVQEWLGFTEKGEIPGVIYRPHGIGIRSYAPDGVVPPGGHASLSALNDSVGYDFKQIAQVILDSYEVSDAE